MISRLARRPRAPAQTAGPWFDHALALALAIFTVADVWMGAYLACVALGWN